MMAEKQSRETGLKAEVKAGVSDAREIGVVPASGADADGGPQGGGNVAADAKTTDVANGNVVEVKASVAVVLAPVVLPEGRAGNAQAPPIIDQPNEAHPMTTARTIGDAGGEGAGPRDLNRSFSSASEAPSISGISNRCVSQSARDDMLA